MPDQSRGLPAWLWAGALGLPVAWYAWARLRPQQPPKATAFDTFLRPGARAAPQQPAKRPPADFRAFLKHAPAAPPARDAASFASFLRKPQAADTDGSTSGHVSGEEEAEAVAGPRPEQKVVCVLFGTEYGFSKEIAEKAAARLRESSEFWPRLLDMAELAEGHPGLVSEQAVLVVCSTQGDGVPPSEAREFCDWLAGAAAPRLPGLGFSVCALGDTSYTHFCACGKALDAQLEALGAARLARRADVNREDWRAVDAWIESAVAALAQLPLKPFAETGGGAHAREAAPKQKRWGKARPFYARVVAVEGLCHVSQAGDKNTVRVELDLGESGLTYTPGDALGILPANCPQAVEELLEVLGMPAEAQVPVPAWHYEEVAPRKGAAMPLREALRLCYDLRSPKVELLHTLLDSLGPHAAAPKKAAGAKTAVHQNGTANGTAAHSASNGHAELTNGRSNGHAEKVGQLQAVLGSGEAAIEAYLEPRHVVDVLEDFAPARPPLEKVLAALRPLLPRLYSISSSQLEHAKRVQVTVAVVRYASLNRQRIGVTSTQLAERIQVGNVLPVYVHKNPDFRLPQDPAVPIIMVGPGTGLAPFRAFMMERLLGAKAAGGVANLGAAALYFGCRRADQDFLYGDQLEAWAAQGKLTLFTAFSRQQAAKVYVQDRLAQSAALVWGLLQAGAHFYVCGDAAHMAGAVEDALLAIIQAQQAWGPPGGTLEAARAYLADLAAQQRYQRDIWY